MANGGSPRDFNEWLLAGLLVALVTFVGSILWLVLSPVLGPVYRISRLVETVGLWSFTGWGRYFAMVPRKGGYEFWSLFLSSIPFGVFFSILIGLMGYSAWQKVRAAHIGNFTAHDEPPSYREIMGKVAPLYPHNAFFLRFDMSAYPQDRGAAGMPMTAQEFLRSAGAISVVDRLPRFDLEKARAGLIANFGPKNPFLRCYDTSGPRPRLTASRDDVSAIVADLPWHHAVVLYATLARINAMTGKDEKAFLSTIKRVDEYMRDVWREIMKAVEAEKAREVVLDIHEGLATEKPPVALAAFLQERAPEFTVVKNARLALPLLITGSATADEVADLNKRIPITGVDDPKARLAIDPVLARRGFIAGVLAHALEETRKSGIFPPNGFLWMRFIDQPLWRSLIYVGMATPCAEASGLFEHYRAETRLGAAIPEPFVEDAPAALVREARRYVLNIDDLPHFDASVKNSLLLSREEQETAA
ncbi:secretion/conjugation apparatus DotM-related subunit [Xanthobacter flavus]|uniref:secretion/conjugation apparatus DotM-related subunit n=1 Tax=Xanthobacter flavus TaxID=281 RepID=UPI003729E2B9